MPTVLLPLAHQTEMHEMSESTPVPERLASFWSLVERSLGEDAQRCFYEASHFDNNERSANELAALVLSGRKRATAGLVWSFDFDQKTPPLPGALSVITNWHGDPVCVIETSAVATLPFQSVDAEFAAAEGEGDGSLTYWRQVHWDYFARECGRIGRVPSETMPVFCERFEVVYPTLAPRAP